MLRTMKYLSLSWFSVMFIYFCDFSSCGNHKIPSLVISSSLGWVNSLRCMLWSMLRSVLRNMLIWVSSTILILLLSYFVKKSLLFFLSIESSFFSHLVLKVVYFLVMMIHRSCWRDICLKFRQRWRLRLKNWHS